LWTNKTSGSGQKEKEVGRKVTLCYVRIVHQPSGLRLMGKSILRWLFIVFVESVLSRFEGSGILADNLDRPTD